MKLYFVLTTLFWMTMTPTANAQSSPLNCAVQDWMTTLYYRAVAITPAAASPNAADVLALRDHRFAKDTANLSVALRQAGLGHLEGETHKFLGAVDQILATPSLLSKIPAQDPVWRRALSQYNQTIALLDCSETATRPRLGLLTGEIPGAMPLDRFAVVVLALSFSAICFAYLASKYLLHLSKIMKRYMIRLPCKLQFNTMTIAAELVDISRSGAKVQLTRSLQNPGKFSAILPGLTVPADVAWHNRNFAGIRFQRKLTRAEIQGLRDNPLAQQHDPPTSANNELA